MTKIDIIIVEDSDDDYEATRRALKVPCDESFQVLRCRSGVEAWDLLNADQTVNTNSSASRKFIILDLNMPGLDGRGLLSRIKNDNVLKSIPIAILTTSDDPADIDECYRRGANTFVKKPVNWELFSESMDNLKAFWFGTAELPVKKIDMKTLLVVDDRAEDREAIVRTFGANLPDRYLVLEAHGEATCLEQLSRNPGIDCVLLDYSMPGCDGLKLLSKVLAHGPDVSVIMITGEGNEDIAVEALKLGAQDYIVKKGFSQTDIRQRVVNALERRDMAKKLAQQQESLRAFASVLAHDLRAPLRSIRGPIEMLTQTDDPLPEEMRERLHQFITTGVDQMDRLIVSLYEFTHTENTQATFEEVDVAWLFETVLQSLSNDIEGSGAQVNVQSDISRIWGASQLIVLLIQNLVENGIKFSVLPQPCVWISITDHLNAWHIQVRDNGIGIAEKYLNDVFEPFKRLHSETKFKGTGLGLATCKRIADMHNADLRCESEPEEGTTFIMTLPKPIATA